MPVTMEQTSELADRIISKRQFLVYESFSHSISNDEKKKYIREIEKGKTKMLVETGAPLWKRGKKGKRYKPMKKAASPQMFELLAKLRKMSSKPIATKRGSVRGYEVTLPYETNRSIDQGGTYRYVTNEGMVEKTGKISAMDREILSTINEWAKSNGLEVDVSLV